MRLQRPQQYARTLALTLLLVVTILAAGCAHTVPQHATISSAIPPAQARDTQLGRAIAPLADAHPGNSGIYLLNAPHDAFAARMLLAKAAERSLDVQYYIWHKDITGIMLLEALHAAADRGVRVRLLIDDNGITGLDTQLAALDTHPNIEVRLFNPFYFRKFKFLGYLTDFKRANRRMHNKSFTADNQATIIGGRNIGDEYFNASGEDLFSDLDVLAVGPVVQEVSKDFDLYWASQSSFPVAQVVRAAQPDDLNALALSATETQKSPDAESYIKSMSSLALVHDLIQGTLKFEWAPTRMVSDDPAKGQGAVSGKDLLIRQMSDIVGKPQHSLNLVSSYFVPTESGTAAFVAMAQRGVKVNIFTNSLAATDVAVVHAGYAKWRKELLAAGISLYEMRRGESASERPRSRPGRFGSSGSSLHAKTFSVDGQHFFVGSFNFDPRSAALNTELGFIIESPMLARQIEAAFNTEIPKLAYTVRLSPEGDLYWIEHHDGKVLRHDTEPETTFWQRAGVWFVSHLPIDWLL